MPLLLMELLNYSQLLLITIPIGAFQQQFGKVQHTCITMHTQKIVPLIAQLDPDEQNVQ